MFDRSFLLLSLLACGAAPAAASDSDPVLPFDFSDAFYLENGIDPTQILGRPDGSPPNSTIDNTPNGPDFNNVRMLEHIAAFDHSGHPIFFYVTGVITLAAFTNDSAGDEAFEIAEEYKVYEFPRAGNATFSVFPKRQDLIADLRGGYFSNDPLGTWQINLVRYTPAAFNTTAGQQALAELAADNGVDLDGTPVIRTMSELEDLEDDGFVEIVTPPIGGPDLRWFFCPVIEDPRDGAIAPDAHLTIVELADGSPLPAEQEIFDLFHCLQTTGDDDCDGSTGGSLGQPYCASTPNSTGQPATLEAQGSANVATNGLRLRASSLPATTPAIFIVGTGQQQLPMGDGFLCVTSPARLVPAGSAQNGVFERTLDFTSPPLAAIALPGASLDFQCWYRDPAGPGGAGFNLTQGLRVTLN